MKQDCTVQVWTPQIILDALMYLRHLQRIYAYIYIDTYVCIFGRQQKSAQCSKLTLLSWSGRWRQISNVCLFSFHLLLPVSLPSFFPFFSSKSPEPLEVIRRGMLSERRICRCLWLDYRVFQELEATPSILHPLLPAEVLPCSSGECLQQCTALQLWVQRFQESQTCLQLIEFRGLLQHKLYLVSKGVFLSNHCQMKSSSQPVLSTYISNALEHQ